MPRSHKSVTGKEKELVLFIQQNEIEIIRMHELASQLNWDSSTAQRALEQLVHHGYLNRVQRGLYCLPTFRDEYIIGQYLLPEGAVAYWTALHRHGLTERFPNVVYMQSPRLKRDTEVFGVRYRFIKVKPEKFTGIITEGFRSRKFRITDREKTIIDCFDLPHYAGEYDDLIRAFAQTDLDAEKLIAYGKVVNNLSAMKRIAFLAELTGKDSLQPFMDEVLSQMNQRYSLFDPSGANQGEFISKWKLRLNISKDALKQIIESTY